MAYPSGKITDVVSLSSRVFPEESTSSRDSTSTHSCCNTWNTVKKQNKTHAVKANVDFQRPCRCNGLPRVSVLSPFQRRCGSSEPAPVSVVSLRCWRWTVSRLGWVAAECLRTSASYSAATGRGRRSPAAADGRNHRCSEGKAKKEDKQRDGVIVSLSYFCFQNDFIPFFCLLKLMALNV